MSCVLFGCTTFSSVRSAEVHPGESFRVEAAVASPPGQGAAWFYNLDCSGCKTIPPGVEVGFEYGVVPTTSGRPFSLGASFNGFFPQLDAYVALGTGEQSAFGIGARVGVPAWSWTAHQLYGRYDRVVGPRKRFLYNPGLGLHIGNSPNGSNPGYLLTLVQGFGLLWEGRTMTFVPSFALVLGTGRRSSYGDSHSVSTAFGTISASVSLHGAREP